MTVPHWSKVPELFGSQLDVGAVLADDPEPPQAARMSATKMTATRPVAFHAPVIPGIWLSAKLIANLLVRTQCDIGSITPQKRNR